MEAAWSEQESLFRSAHTEAEELAVAPTRENARWEAADLLYHALVEMRAKGVRLAEVVAELESRHLVP